MDTVNQLLQSFVVLSPDKHATIEAADESLYERIETNYAGFEGHELISCFEFESDWTSWEMHPEGDEVVILISGSVDFILEKESGNESLSLGAQGQFVIVPKGVWHTAKTNIKSKLLFITPGQGTQHREN